MTNESATAFPDFVDFEQLRNSVVCGPERKRAFGCIESLPDHLDMVRKEFVGRTQLEYYHAYLIVLLRRNVNTKTNADNFFRLWSNERKFLCGALDTRWLVSACDTIIDWSPDQTERSLALCGSLFINTLKLHETELLIMTNRQNPPDWGSTYRVKLFDGVTSFAVGRGDAILNLSRRLSDVVAADTLASNILRELFRRANVNDTVYRRFLNLHENVGTKWS